MPAYTNFVAIGGPRNATTTHTVDPSSATGVVAGAPFTPTAGRRLVVVADGAVTSTTPSGWTLPTSGSAINNTGLYVWHRVAAGGDTFTTTHNAANYPAGFAIFEYPAGTTFVGSVAATSVNIGVVNPTLSGLTGTNTVIGVAAGADATAGGAISATWSSPNVELLDTNEEDAATDGYWLGIAYQDAYATATYAPTPTIGGTVVGANSERLTFAVNVPAGSALTQNIGDTIAGVDAQTKAAAHPVADPIGGTDTLAHSWAAKFTQSDAGTFGDSINAGGSTAHTHSVSDGLAGTDARANRVQALRPDTAALTDATAKAPKHPVADTIAATDARSLKPGKGLADTSEITDSGMTASAAITLSDTAQFSDTIDTGGDTAHTRNINDGLAGTDARAKRVTRPSTDIAALTDSSPKRVTRTQPDTGALTDGVTTDGTQGAQHSRSISDGIAATDTFARQWNARLALQDATPTTDALARTWTTGLTLADTAVLTDLPDAHAIPRRWPLFPDGDRWDMNSSTRWPLVT